MTGVDITAQLRSGGVKLAFDTNALSGKKRLGALCTRVKHWNEQLSARTLPEVKLLVCTVAHFEELFHIKKSKGDLFDMRVILDGMDSLGIEVQPFGVDHALSTAMWLGERHKTSEEWRRAKKKRYMHGLGLTLGKDEPEGAHCSTTVDWLIAGHAQAERCVLVTDDEGPEFEGFADKVRLGELEAALKQLLSESA
ncbi:hypothetical protein [Polyangium aurulentum]|uniref:hypothetical protein n=1 Tax=Polyangium aurulentum TaxID=2567896 RepID=UPI0010AE7FAA|nr:hypothetical protein [Polyangium aurulentum]UQA56781.1 hypothetical protein E8A73_036590 [Polyangium aurulentum]